MTEPATTGNLVVRQEADGRYRVTRAPRHASIFADQWRLIRAGRIRHVQADPAAGTFTIHAINGAYTYRVRPATGPVWPIDLVHVSDAAAALPATPGQRCRWCHTPMTATGTATTCPTCDQATA